MVNINKIKELLECAICKENISGVPRILHCCNKTVCEKHLNQKNETPQEFVTFKCLLCQTSHELSAVSLFLRN